jgi:hypothetical protein
MDSFDSATLAQLRRRREVTIETSRGNDAPVHSAVIWVVVDDRDRVLIRSWLGERSRWYRELRANPHGALVVGDRRVDVRAQDASDPERVEACSSGLRAKYRTATGSLEQMLADDVLATTLELHLAG